jgi:hypothetical protein
LKPLSRPLRLDALVEQPNSYPKFARLQPEFLAKAYHTLAELSEAFQRANFQARESVTRRLGDSAKFIMAEYTKANAIEGRRAGSRDTILQGLVPVVMAAERSDTATGAKVIHAVRESWFETRYFGGCQAAETIIFRTDVTAAPEIPTS